MLFAVASSLSATTAATLLAVTVVEAKEASASRSRSKAEPLPSLQGEKLLYFLDDLKRMCTCVVHSADVMVMRSGKGQRLDVFTL